MNTIHKMIANRNVVAWLLLVSAVGLHVFDETMTDFLPFYNQSVLNLREQLGLFPAPTFSFSVWLGGLIGAIVLGYSITPFVHRGGRIIRIITLMIGTLMAVNALSHLLGSIYVGEILPGMRSSPFLLVAAIFVIVRGSKGDWKIQHSSMEGGS